MPQSKNRQEHYQHLQHHNPPKRSGPAKTNNTIIAGIIFFGIIGLGIGFFAAGSNIIALVAGALIGGIGGYLFGRQMNKAFSKK